MTIRRMLLGLSLVLLTFASNTHAALTLDISFDDSADGTWDQVEKDVILQAAAEWEAGFAPYDLDATISFGMDFRWADMGGGTLAVTYGWVWGGVPGLGESTRPWLGTGHYMGWRPDTLWWDPTPETDNDIPGGAVDALTVARHELGHLLGFTGGLHFDNWGIPGQRDVWQDAIVANVFDPGGLNVPMAGGNNEHSVGGLMGAFITPGQRIGIDQTMDMIAHAYDLQLAPPPNPCVIGDADCDGYVDVGGDIFPAFTNFTGPGSFGMTRADGDVQSLAEGATTNPDGHDGDVDVSDILAMFSNFTGPAPIDDAGGLVAAEALDSTIPDLIYDASTGEVLLDLDSAVGFTGYVLNSANGFITGNHTPFMAGVTTTLPYELAEATFGTPAGPYPKSIGNVFPSGMDMAALSAFLTGNQVSRGNNQPIVPFDLVIVNPVSSGVPEPAAVVMGIMALAGFGMVAHRRRRAA